MRMIPDVGSEWIDRAGRKMRVDEVNIPTNPENMPWCKMTVLNPIKRTPHQTTMSIENFGAKLTSDF
jgi:hypothetical protein